MKRSRRRLLAGLAVVALAGTLVGSGPVEAAGHRLPVLGFQEDGDPVSAIASDAGALHAVGVDGVDVTLDGKSVGAPGADDARQRAAAHAHGLAAVLVVGNWSNPLGDFSEPVAHRLLRSATHRRHVAARLGRVVRRRHWNGINVDLESLRPRDRAGLTAFLRVLRHDLPARARLSIDLMNATTAAGMRAWGYDLHAIGRIVDQAVLMAYDEHGPWEPTPGPVGALGWQRAGLHVLEKSVPRHKIALGVAGYGYAWGPSGAVTVSDERARTMVSQDGATATWSAKAGEWTATLSDGTVLWWSDHRSWERRVTMAHRQHLGGLAVWDLELSDPLG